MTFDPWETSGSDRAVTKVRVGEKTFSKTLFERAKRRVPGVHRVSGRVFVVAGDEKLGDTYPEYRVTWLGGDKYDCDCYSLNHGEQRAKRTCSHVLAVMIYRSELRQQIANSGNGKGGTPHSSSSSTNQLELSEPVRDRDSHSTVDGEPVNGQSSSIPMASESADVRVNIPAVSDRRFVEWDSNPLPQKFTEIRDVQWDAIGEVVEHFRSGVECVMLDGPTGTGKSLIAEIVRRLMQRRAFYICHSKTLQEQFVSDFRYAQVLKGRSNYPTLNGPLEVTCADCTKNDPMDDCQWCEQTALCPYEAAKNKAIQSKLAVLNTAYFLAEFNYVGKVGAQRELGVIDECDTLESELMDFAEFRLGERILHSCQVQVPKEGSHRTTIGKWLTEEFKPALYDYMKTVRGDDLKAIRERMRTQRLMADVLRIGRQIEADEALSHWVRDVKAGPLVLKPIIVNDYGDRYVWKHAKNWLCMSATIISGDELADSTGLQGGQGEGQSGRRWELVTVPMTFPIENRRITVAGVADMSRKGKEDGEWEVAATALRNVCLRHPNDRVLVHTVSYELARFLMDRVAHSLHRPVLTYTESSSRDSTLRRFRGSPNAVLIAASMDRGVDLANDDCRVVVVMKVPFPYLGDRRVQERMRLPGGKAWYAVQTIRKLVQMTGRAVRSKDDWCHTYILDRQFVSNVWKKNRLLLPAWWREAVDMTADVRELIRP